MAASVDYYLSVGERGMSQLVSSDWLPSLASHSCCCWPKMRLGRFVRLIWQNQLSAAAKTAGISFRRRRRRGGGLRNNNNNKGPVALRKEKERERERERCR